MVTTTKICIVLMAWSAAFSLFAQDAWIPAEGNWDITDAIIAQNDATNKLSRLDVKILEEEPIEVAFNVSYIAGGFQDEEMLKKGEYHAGFGVHFGVEDPVLRQRSWGNGNSYLLWINLDTRGETRSTKPEHYGLRAQVYKSNSPSNMGLLRSDLIAQDAALQSMSVDNYASLDLIKVINNLSGLNPSVEDVINYFAPTGVDVRLRVNPRSGNIAVTDPTNSSVYFTFDLEPSVLRGDYISFRTNSVALQFNDIVVQ